MNAPTANLRPANEWASWIALIFAIVICFATAGLGSALTTPGLEPWYAGINKPSFNPPNWIFGPVWTVLFLAMAVALWRIWRVVPIDAQSALMRRKALIAFGVQLALNVTWSASFFYLQNPVLALGVIVVFLASLLACVAFFRSLDRIAAWLFAPYIAWVSFASLLNAAIVALN